MAELHNHLGPRALRRVGPGFEIRQIPVVFQYHDTRIRRRAAINDHISRDHQPRPALGPPGVQPYMALAGHAFHGKIFFHCGFYETILQYASVR
jgi:hypothetical protein